MKRFPGTIDVAVPAPLVREGHLPAEGLEIGPVTRTAAGHYCIPIMRDEHGDRPYRQIAAVTLTAAQELVYTVERPA